MEKQEERPSLFQQAMLFLKAENYQKALEVFLQIRDLEANNHLVYMFLGETYRNLELLPEAFTSLSRAQELFELANAKKDPRNDNEKIRALLAGKNEERLLRSPRISYYLALCWDDFGNIEKAVDFLKKAAEFLFDELVDDREEFLYGPAKVFRDAETLEELKDFDGAFDLLEPLVYKKICDIEKAAVEAKNARKEL